MKKTSMVIAGIILAFTATSVQAQNEKITLEINGGGGLSSLRNTSDYDIGFSGELNARYLFNEHFSALLGFGYEQIGVREDIVYHDLLWEPMYTYATRKSFNYLKIPLLFRAETGQKTKYFLQLGATYGHLLSRIYNYSDQNDDALYIQAVDTYQTPNISATAGVGVQFSISDKIGLSLEVRENFGLLNISTSDNTTANTQSLHLLAGVNYCL